MRQVIVVLLFALMPTLAEIGGWDDNRVSAAGLTQIDIVCVDEKVTRRAVANPTNQKVVSNENGIFLTYLCTSTQQDQKNRWRLMQSVDAGDSFEILYQEIAATKAPTLDTDQFGNLYLCRPDYSTRGPNSQQSGVVLPILKF